ncbi:MAG: hypothetical protein OEV42_13795 [Deltaproteobacteria bacterium]|nr:hypothetical protein [Deltaproteobacteria bacterium]
MAEVKPKIMIVSYAAGGAEVLSSWIKLNKPEEELLFCLDGPAIQIFSNKLGDIQRVSIEKISYFDPNVDKVIASTGWSPDFERRAIEEAQKKNIYNITIIDHWKNYRERYLPSGLWKEIPNNWQSYLSNEVWVCDKYAYNLALELGFPPHYMKQIENPYLQDFKEKYTKKSKINKVDNHNNIRVLFISEPISQHYAKKYNDSNYLGYTEYDLVESLIDAFKKAQNLNVEIELKLRLHPSEPKEKYSNIIKESCLFEVSENQDMLHDLIWTDAVVGSDSMALVLSLAVGKPVFSVIPPTSKKDCSIPYKGIRHKQSFLEVINDLVRAKGEDK